MALEIFKLIGSVFVDTDEAEKSIKKTDKSAEGLGKNLLKGVGTVAKWGAGIVASAGAGAAALYGLATNAASAMDAIDKGSAKIGISKTAYQEWSYVLGQNGMDVSKLEVGMKSLVSAMDGAAAGTKSAQEKFDALGLSIYDANGGLKDQETMLQETLYALADMENGTEKARLATELFGKAGVEMMPMLNGGADGMAELTARAHELGLVVSDEAVTAGVVLGDTIDDVKQSFNTVIAKIGVKLMPVIQNVLDWVLAHMPEIQATCETVFNAISTVVSTVVDWFDAVIEVFTDFSEQAAPYVSDAIDVLSAAIETVIDWISQGVDWFQSMATWAGENQGALELLAIAVGTLTAAVIAYNAAQAIKNAGGIVELAQLASTAIGVGALTVAETAHTVASNIATVATTAFGAAVNFLTSPITLVVLAIGSLIAIVVLLIQNWDTVKAVAIQCWERIKGAWDTVASWFNINVIQPISNFFSGLWGGIQNTFSGVVSWFTGIFQSAVRGVQNVWSGITGWFRNLLNNVKRVFQTIGDAIANVFKMPINAIIDGINSFIRGLNSLKVPDWVPGVGGWGFSLPTIPRLEKGAVLEKGQMGLLEGNGAEAVVPLEKNKKWISAVANDMDTAMGGALGGQVLAILMDILSAVEDIAKMGVYLDKDALVGGLAKPLDRKLGQIQAQKARA